jgi:hypothetical protein
MLPTGSPRIDAERAFSRAARSRRRAALVSRLGRKRSACDHLPVFVEPDVRPQGSLRGVREIPLDQISGTLEPSRAPMFDASFRPAAAARRRWEQVWLAEQRGTVLPPVDVVPVPGGYALRDGHHRVSVAAARGALTIDARIGVSGL